MDGTSLCKIARSGGIHGPRPYEVIGSRTRVDREASRNIFELTLPQLRGRRRLVELRLQVIRASHYAHIRASHCAHEVATVVQALLCKGSH